MSKVDWSKLVAVILDDLLYSQKELAKICKVTQQTVSNWRNGIRNPSVYSKRQMVKILNESGIDVPADNRPYGLRKNLPKTDVEELVGIFKSMNESRRRAVLEFAKFQLQQEG
jgi:transcriptional regulator with XRE-family HTH domain